MLDTAWHAGQLRCVQQLPGHWAAQQWLCVVVGNFQGHHRDAVLLLSLLKPLSRSWPVCPVAVIPL